MPDTTYPTTVGSTALKLLAIGLLATGLTLAGVAWTTGSATAQVSADSLSVSDGTYAADNASVYSPHLVVTGTASFGVDSTPAGWTVALQVAPAGTENYETVATDSGGAISSDMAFEFETVGALIDHSAFNSSDFDPARNTTVSHDVDVRIVLTVEDDTGSAIVTANATDSATVSVENTLDELSASLSGDGYVLFQENEGDGAPTPTATPTG